MFLAKADILANFAKCQKSFWMYISIFFERSLSCSRITTQVPCKFLASVFACEAHSDKNKKFRTKIEFLAEMSISQPFFNFRKRFVSYFSSETMQI